jgi:hypothetical protein
MNRKTHGVSVGSASLIMILAVLCLTIFSVLSLSSARASMSLASRTADKTSAYYAADAAACDVLGAIVSGDAKAGGFSVGGSSVDISAADYGGKTVYSYSVPIDDSSALFVEASVSGGKYDILRWQAVNISSWSPDDSLNVWDGETGE